MINKNATHLNNGFITIYNIIKLNPRLLVKIMSTEIKQLPSHQYSPCKRKSSTPIRRNINQIIPCPSPSPYLDQNPQYIQPSAHNDPRQYKLLLYIFSSNINTYYNKVYKGMLGQLEDSYKVPLTKQQKYTAQNNIQSILQRNTNKLCRDILMRNNYIIKGINQYAEGYKKYKDLQLNASLNIGQNENGCENIASMTIQLTNQNSKDKDKQNIKNRLNSLSQSFTNPTQRTQQKQLIKKRPSTSNRTSLYHKSQQMGSFSANNNIFKNRNLTNNISNNNHDTITNVYGKNNMKTHIVLGQQNQYHANIQDNNQFHGLVYIREGSSRKVYKNKYKTNNTANINYNYNYHTNIENDNIRILISQKVNSKMVFENNQMNIGNQNYFSNSEKNNNSRYDNYDINQMLEMYQSDYQNKYKWESQKYIQHSKNNNIDKNKKNTNLFCSFYHKQQKHLDRKNNFNRLFNQTNYTVVKSIDEKNLQKIQSRIMSIGSSLSTNTTKQQGYKPKSKCWGTTVVSSGKLNSQPNKNGLISNGNTNHTPKNIFSMMKHNNKS